MLLLAESPRISGNTQDEILAQMKSKAMSLTSDKEGRVSSAKPHAFLNIYSSNERIVYSSCISWAYCKCTF